MKKFNLRKVFVTLTSALLISGLVFGTVGVAAATEEAAPVTAPASAKTSVTYNPETDMLDITNPKDLGEGKYSITIFECKSTDEKQIAGSKARTFTATSAAFSIPLNDKQKGFNVKATKDLYLYATTAEVKGSTKYPITPDITIAKSAYKKVAVELNYAVVGSGSNAIASIKATPVDGEETTLKVDENIRVSTSSNPEYKSATIFSGFELETLLEAASAKKAKVTVDVLVKGTATSRSMAAKTVKVKKAGKAPAAKVDIAKNTIAIKNGFDYAAVEVSKEDLKTATAKGAKPGFETLKTVLAKKSGGTAEKTEIDTKDFVPSKTDLTMYTTKAIKSIEIPAFESDYLVYYIRKSAGVGKPATEFATVAIAKPADAPAVTAATTGAALKLTITAAEGAESGLEYCILNSSDVTNVDWASVKWTKYKAAGIKAKNLKTTKAADKEGTKIDKAEATTGAKLFIRNVGKKATKTAGAILPSAKKELTLTIADNAFGDTTGLDKAKEAEPETPAQEPAQQPAQNPEQGGTGSEGGTGD